MDVVNKVLFMLHPNMLLMKIPKLSHSIFFIKIPHISNPILFMKIPQISHYILFTKIPQTSHPIYLMKFPQKGEKGGLVEKVNHTKCNLEKIPHPKSF